MIMRTYCFSECVPEFLEIHCLRFKKLALCLEHAYYSDCWNGIRLRRNFSFERQGAEASLLQMEAKSKPHYASEACHTLEIYLSCTVRRFEKKDYFDDFRNFKTYFSRIWNNLEELQSTNVYCKAQTTKQVTNAHWNFLSAGVIIVCSD